MIIGAIEACSQEHIAGWVYSSVTPLSGNVVLAFLDGQCIGSGNIDLFRQDLANAGLGDGVLGFGFNITVPKKIDVARVVITLSGCEAYILQRGARVVGVDDHKSPSAYIGGQLPSPEQVSWLLGHDVFSQTDADLVTALSSFGAAIEPIDTNEVTESVKSIFEKIVIGPVVAAYVDVPFVENIADILIENEATRDAGMFALVSERRLVVSVQETTSDALDMSINSPVVGGIDHVLDPRSTLIVRRWTPFMLKQQLVNTTVRVYFPVSKPLE